MSLTQKDIIYFIVTDRFCGVPNPTTAGDIDASNPLRYHGGNLEGLRAKIPYLKQLGVTAVWITPVYLQLDLPHADGYHGYWALDFNAVDPHFYRDDGRFPKGSKLYVREIADALHEAGLKLILDMVVNHTGYDHPAKTGLGHNPTPIAPHWFNQAGQSCAINEIEGELSGLPDLDLDNRDVCDYHIATIIDWIRSTGIDAVRMDTVKHVESAFWNDFKTQIMGLFPDVDLLGEVLEFDIDKVARFQRRYAFDSLFDFPLQQAMCEVFIDDQPLTRLWSAFDKGTGLLEKDWLYTNANTLTTLLDNHDLSARFMTLCLRRHNGDVRAATAAMKLALSLQFTVRGIPQLYYGTELGLEGGADPDNRRDFEWHKLDERCEVQPEHRCESELYIHLRKLIALRRGHDALTCGDFVCLYADQFLLVYLRYVEDDIVICALNNGWQDMPAAVEVNLATHARIPSRIKGLLANTTLHCALSGMTLHTVGGVLSLSVPGKSALALLA